MRIILLPTVAAAVALACGESSAPKAKPSPLATVTIVSGDSQQGTVGTALALPIVIQAVDSNGHPASGLFVIFEPVNGTVNDTNVTTDSAGHASTMWTLGATPGLQELLPTVQGTGQIVVIDTVVATGTP